MKNAEMMKRQLLIDYARRFGLKEFVETGTYKGDTVKAMILSGLFDQIWTVDIYEDRVQNAQRRFQSSPQVHCLHGDSAVVLPVIVSQLRGPALFWLDAHHSGKQIARVRGLIDTPILAELRAVLAYPHANDSVVIIDDARYYEEFSKRYPNYPATEALKALMPADWQFEVKEDIIRCHR